MKVIIDTGEDHYIELSREGEQVSMFSTARDRGFPVTVGHTLTVEQCADLEYALAAVRMSAMNIAENAKMNQTPPDGQ